MSVVHVNTGRGSIFACDVGGMLVMGPEAFLLDKQVHPDEPEVDLHDIPTVTIEEIGCVATVAASQS